MTPGRGEFHFADDELDGEHVEQAIARLLSYALAMRAGDLFFASNEADVSLFVRHLGILKPLTCITVEQGRRFITSIKALAGMDLAQKRRPLDGRWVFRAGEGEKVDVRINTIPTLYGEDMAIRMLGRETGFLDVQDLGLHRRDLDVLMGILGSPSGLVLVTGPGGSGKTTTLYACLEHLNDGTRKINTIEDPIEYAMQGFRQSQVNPRINLGFAELLRSVLRQSPDVIMVGEIRDPTTAETAVRAANSGHLVLATLHAPMAAGAVASMLGLGVHPHFLATSMLGILTQRLIRTLCQDCKVAYDLSDSPLTFDDVRRWLADGEGEKIHSSPGCERCGQDGYTGRTGVFEVLHVTPEIRHLIHEGAMARDVHAKAVEQGMLDMRRSALLKVAGGVTSTEEMIRVIPVEQLMAGK